MVSTWFVASRLEVPSCSQLHRCWGAQGTKQRPVSMTTRRSTKPSLGVKVRSSNGALSCRSGLASQRIAGALSKTCTHTHRHHTESPTLSLLGRDPELLARFPNKVPVPHCLTGNEKWYEKDGLDRSVAFECFRSHSAKIGGTRSPTPTLMEKLYDQSRFPRETANPEIASYSKFCVL